MRLLIFEDEFYRNFYPMTFTRPIYDLRIGFYSLLKHFIDFFGFETILYVRDYLAEFLKVRFRDFDVNSVDDYDDILLINGRLMPRAANLNFIKSLIVDNRFFILLDSIGVVAARLSKPLLRDLLSQCVNGILSSKIFLNLHGKCDFICLNDGMLISYPWELIIFNEEFLKSDFKFGGSLGEIDSRVIVYGSNSNLYLGENSRVEGNVNIDVRAGPIYVGRDVTVLGPCRIEGPSYIGDGSIVLAGARIRSGSNIGMVCRVGGEVEASILHGYVNMYHPSFVGHSYIGEWVNLGAFTVTSDLKNTYGNIRVKVNDSIINTGLNKVGSFIGDHVKTSINCGIFSGKCIGAFSHLIGYVYEDVPPFTIYAKSIMGKSYELRLESVIETICRVYSRRGRNVLQEEINLVKHLFESSEDERIKADVIKGSLSFT